jgi:hypothetical protein
MNEFQKNIKKDLTKSLITQKKEISRVINYLREYKIKIDKRLKKIKRVIK